MQYSHRIVNQALIVTIDGELDLHTAPPFKEYMDKLFREQDSVKHLVLDVGKVSFIDSSGLGVILGRYRVIQGRGGKLLFVNSSPQIKRVLELSGMQKIAQFADSAREAVDML